MFFSVKEIIGFFSVNTNQYFFLGKCVMLFTTNNANEDPLLCYGLLAF